jgi:heme ABC exporter ATP-binding subunit CcmA
MGNELAVRLRYAVALAGRYPLLAGADLDVSAGEILVLRGANGAGKTSLLRVIAGLLPLSAGEAMVLGLDPSFDARTLRRRVGLLGHANALYDDLTAEENVRFAARAARLPREAVPEALERLGIRDRLLTLPARRLSAGQRRRVALASLLARRPQLWLLDEPHAGLDAEHRELLDGVLKDVTFSGATVIAASHEERTSDVLADRVVTMSGGTVINGLLPGPTEDEPMAADVGEELADSTAEKAEPGEPGEPAEEVTSAV